MAVALEVSELRSLLGEQAAEKQHNPSEKPAN